VKQQYFTPLYLMAYLSKQWTPMSTKH
jgi:hypothetical protein